MFTKACVVDRNASFPGRQSAPRRRPKPHALRLAFLASFLATFDVLKQSLPTQPRPAQAQTPADNNDNVTYGLVLLHALFALAGLCQISCALVLQRGSSWLDVVPDLGPH